MTWDFAEANILGESTGGFSGSLSWIPKVLDDLSPINSGIAEQADAATCNSTNRVISTDPPYYDNIGYADLSDYFYVWLRRTLRNTFPKIFTTVGVPKTEELIAAPHRQGGKSAAEDFFLNGMTRVMSRLARESSAASPTTIYYAFKQSESKGDTTSNTGWHSFLTAVVSSGFAIQGTWPMRTERDFGVKSGSNVLASSVILVCRRRGENAGTISRRQFIRQLNETLPKALDDMTRESEGMPSPVPGRPLAGDHRSWHGDLLEVRRGPRGRRLTDDRQDRPPTHQPLPRRRRLRRRHSVLPDLVPATRLERRRVWRSQHPRPGQGHQRRWR